MTRRRSQRPPPFRRQFPSGIGSDDNRDAQNENDGEQLGRVFERSVVMRIEHGFTYCDKNRPVNVRTIPDKTRTSPYSRPRTPVSQQTKTAKNTAKAQINPTCATLLAMASPSACRARPALRTDFRCEAMGGRRRGRRAAAGSFRALGGDHARSWIRSGSDGDHAALRSITACPVMFVRASATCFAPAA